MAGPPTCHCKQTNSKSVFERVVVKSSNGLLLEHIQSANVLNKIFKLMDARNPEYLQTLSGLVLIYQRKERTNTRSSVAFHNVMSCHVGSSFVEIAPLGTREYVCVFFLGI